MPVSGASGHYDVLSIGNAIVDVMRRCDDAFLTQLGAHKGHMTLMDSAADVTAIERRLKPGVEVAGGGATNLAVGVAYLGGRAAYIGRVAEDEYGRIFRHDLRTAGIDFTAPPTTAPGKETARSLILITPDGKRTMFTYLGCAAEIDTQLIDAPTVGKSKIVFAEGFLMDRPGAKSALMQATKMAAAANKVVALSLSDAQCVRRHRAAFLGLVKGGLGVCFANEHEIKALYDTDNLDHAMQELGQDAKIAVITRSERGSLILSGGKTMAVPAQKVAKVVDVTGAGEFYAAGFLFGLARGMDLGACARLGAFAGAEVVGVMGARPESKLGQLAKMRGLLK